MDDTLHGSEILRKKPPAKTAKTLFCFHGHFNYQLPSTGESFFCGGKSGTARHQHMTDPKSSMIHRWRWGASFIASKVSSIWRWIHLYQKTPWREGTTYPEKPWVWWTAKGTYKQIFKAVNLQGCRYVWVDDEISSHGDKGWVSFRRRLDFYTNYAFSKFPVHKSGRYLFIK